ncbi:hypothetical protein KFE25_014383 [Diacronema lutheri]|uniref:Uncharacterized protein n=1 Tax=Diacronema lutheri TaxID=2081491 RepID=A0A8J5XJL1_DIALT|nr:hypothetical protein KFE25_014383 [Diacronema lutheri]
MHVLALLVGSHQPLRALQASAAQRHAAAFPSRPQTDAATCCALAAASRRDVAQLGALALGAVMLPGAARASSNPANSYYFPMAKYRYLPRINRAFRGLTESATQPEGAPADWQALGTVWTYADDATTALTLYANSVEGSRSSKGKRKSARIKQLYVYAQDYTAGVAKLAKAVTAHKAADVPGAVQESLTALQRYKDLADINGANAMPPDVPIDQQKYIAVFKGGGYKNEGKVIIPLR